MAVYLEKMSAAETAASKAGNLVVQTVATMADCWADVTADPTAG